MKRNITSKVMAIAMGLSIAGTPFAGENQLLQLDYSYDDYEHSGMGMDTLTFID
ncbi:hypothetical protein AALB16_13735 [Lachnospiraceae bacterium 62-35]